MSKMTSRIRQLLNACEAGDVQSMEALLDQGMDVNSSDDEDITALQVACANGHEQVVKSLLMHGASVNKSNNCGWTPLMQSARYGHLGVLSILLQNGADINHKSRLNVSALTLACRGGFGQAARLLLEMGADFNNSGSFYEYTPLLAAALNGHDAVLRFLLDRGSDVNYQTTTAGLTPLMLAAINGHMTTAQILIERGCGPNTVNVAGKTALDMANARGKREVKGYLDRKTQVKTTKEPEEVQPDIIESTKHGDLQQIRDILDTDPSQRDASSPQDGATPLMFAAMTGRLDIAQLLVESGCDMDKQDSISGWTALMQATYHGKKNVVVYLVNACADVTIQARNGCTAFDMASLIDDVDTEMLRLLASRTLQVNRVDKGKKAWSKQNGTSLMSLNSSTLGDDQQKSGIKGWWSRMSNRFRNLKLGRTFNLSTNRLVTLSPEMDDDLTIKSVNTEQSAISGVKSATTLPRPSPTTTITSYDTMLLETKKSAAMYTLVKNWEKNQPVDVMGTETLKPVIPPFLPLPSFGLDDTNRSKREIVTGASNHTRADAAMSKPFEPHRVVTSHKLGHTTGSPLISSHYRPSVNISPSSSGGASSVGVITKGPSYRHHALFDIGYQNSLQSNTLFMSRTKVTKPLILDKSNTTSPNSSTSGSSSLTPQCSYGKSASSKESTASTLTPSPSPLPKESNKKSDKSSVNPANDKPDELSEILRVISLERYQPIFEEQEVDMEAFLTLTDGDLKELGIGQVDSRRQILTTITHLSHGKDRGKKCRWDMKAFLTLTDGDLKELGIGQVDSRRQILTTITHLSHGKVRHEGLPDVDRREPQGVGDRTGGFSSADPDQGRERQQFHETMRSFQNTLHSKDSSTDTSYIEAIGNNHDSRTDPRTPSSKSRAS